MCFLVQWTAFVNYLSYYAKDKLGATLSKTKLDKTPYIVKIVQF